MKRKNIFILLGIILGVILISGIALAIIQPNFLSVITTSQIPLKINNREVSCNSNQDCINAVASQFRIQPNDNFKSELDLMCINNICQINKIKPEGKQIG